MNENKINYKKSPDIPDLNYERYFELTLLNN